jgi:hypothetical protein
MTCLGKKRMDIYKFRQQSNESGMAFLFRFLKVNANAGESRIQRPKDLISLLIEKLNPQYQAKFKRFRCREIEELQEAIADFDKERREIVSVEKSKTKVSLISDFLSEEEETPGAERQDDLAESVANKVLAIMGRTLDSRAMSDYGAMETRGQSNRGSWSMQSRGRQDRGPQREPFNGTCHYCHKIRHVAVVAWPWLDLRESPCTFQKNKNLEAI